MKTSTYSRKKRQLASAVNELHKMIRNQENQKILNRIKRKIKSLIHELSFVVPRHQLIRILGAFAVVFGFSSNGQAQSFLTPVSNPFNLATPSDSIFGLFDAADLDGDGDQDILVISAYGDTYYYENVGSASAPSFAAAQEGLFPIDASTDTSFTGMSFVDLDGDGDMDLMLGKYDYYGGDLVYHENQGSSSSPSFAEGVTLPFGLTVNDFYHSFPDFADMDGDGDMDLLITDYYANFQYYENTGSASSPAFTAPVENPFGLTTPNGSYLLPNLADLDGDGDLDLLLGGIDRVLYHENTGTASAPVFGEAQENPFGLSFTTMNQDTYIAAVMVDMDNDGDLDVMTQEYGGVFYFHENGDATASASNALENEMNGFISPNPFKDVIQFNFEQNVMRAEFMNLSGQRVLTLDKPNHHADVSGLESGMYILRCFHDDHRITVHSVQKEH